MAAVQHFLVTMKCGHFYQVSAVLEKDGKPFAPDYTKQVLPARCCGGDHAGASQKSIPMVIGKPSQKTIPQRLQPPAAAPAKAIT